MRRKGFTVIELVVSMALTSMVMILLFNMIFSLKDLYINAVLKTELLNKQTIMNQNLNKLLAEKEVKGLYECGKDCLRFAFTDRTNTKLEIDKKNKTFSIGSYKTKLVSGSEFGDIKLLTNTIEGVEENKNDSYLTLEIPVKHSLLSDEEYGINTIYQYDMEAMDIGSVDVVDMAEKINELENCVNSLKNENQTILDKFNKMYPVGSSYISESNTNPSEIFGGSWELEKQEPERIYMTSQVIKTSLSGTGTSEKKVFLTAGNYSSSGDLRYAILNEMFQNIDIPEGYHREYRLSYQVRTSDGQVTIYLNNISVAGSTASQASYKRVYTSAYFKESDVTLETTYGYDYPGINLYYDSTSTGAWDINNVTINGYLVSDKVQYHFRRVS